MLEGDKIKVAQGENPCYLLLEMCIRDRANSSSGLTVREACYRRDDI